MLNRPGEYEVKGVFITGVQTWRKAGAQGEPKEENVVYVFEFNDLTLCHLGDLSQVLTQAQVEALPNIDVLIVPVGGGSALNADEAAEVISLVEPSIVIPMHYQTPLEVTHLDPLSKFLEGDGRHRTRSARHPARRRTPTCRSKLRWWFSTTSKVDPAARSYAEQQLKQLKGQ